MSENKYTKKESTELTGGRRGKKQNYRKNFGAREAFEKRKREGRPKQVWMKRQQVLAAAEQAGDDYAYDKATQIPAAKKGEKGAMPVHVQ